MCVESKQRIAILTSPNQWFVPYAQELQHLIPKAQLYFSHLEMKESYEVVFILSYHQIIPQEFLDKNCLNLFIHASSLPKGKGWSPLFWQVLEGKDSVVFTLFKADAGVDSGVIYLQKTLRLNGLELYEELQEKQARMCQEMCLEFLERFPKMNPKAQRGEPSLYPKRTAKDSELDITKSIESQEVGEKGKSVQPKKGEIPTISGVISAICLDLEDYADLSIGESCAILEIRNLESVKSNLYNQHNILQDEHFAFIESLKNNKNKQYFLIRFCGKILGSINFAFKGEEAEFGFFANPNLNIGGIGRVLEQISLFYVFKILGKKKLSLEVFCSNKQVINLHKKFGFKEESKKQVLGKEVLEMSLRLNAL